MKGLFSTIPKDSYYVVSLLDCLQLKELFLFLVVIVGHYCRDYEHSYEYSETLNPSYYYFIRKEKSYQFLCDLH